MSDIDTAIEQVLRDLAPASRYQTRHVVDRIEKLGFAKGAVYKRLLAIASRCPVARQDKGKAFVRFGHTCYPWTWAKLPPGQPLVVPPKPQEPGGEPMIVVDDGTIERIAQRVASILSVAGELTLATVGPISAEPEECILCGEQFTDGEDGVCRQCLAPEEV